MAEHPKPLEKPAKIEPPPPPPPPPPETDKFRDFEMDPDWSRDKRVDTFKLP